jgi:hypothetical protein
MTGDLVNGFPTHNRFASGGRMPKPMSVSIGRPPDDGGEPMIIPQIFLCITQRHKKFIAEFPTVPLALVRS